jgi:hypothetical protein
MSKLLRDCGYGLRLMECLWLRAKNLEFERWAVVVRDGTGEQNGVTQSYPIA